MRKSTIVTILLIYLASIVAVGFLGTRVRIYDEIRLVSSISISVRAANEKSFKYTGESVGQDESTGFKIYKMTAYYNAYQENGVLEFAFIPVFTFKDGKKEEMTGKAVSYQIEPSGYVDSGWLSITNNGILSLNRGTMDIDLYIRPISTEKISAISDSGILIKLQVRR